MVADQVVVPVAVPAPPVLVAQATDVTPTLSLAVPLNTIVVAEVETEVAPGKAMASVGAVPDNATEVEAVDQVTEMVPVPPDAEPARVTVVAVVVAAVAFTDNVSPEGVGLGVGVGVITAAPCAAYNV